VKDTLQITTPSDREIVVTRTFDAPRAVVWDAMTKPELLRRWLHGPPGWEMVACEDDRRPGGAFRWSWRGPGGQEMVVSGVNREIVPPERGVRTERFEVGCGPQAGEQLATLALTERAGKTTMTLTLVYPSKEARDGTIASGMEHGMAAGYDRLDGLLAAARQG
jgi:uncharacterized protein YndB with AHSA1/START domain